MESALLAFVTALLALVTMLVFVHVVDHQRARRALVQCILVALQPLLTLDSRFMYVVFKSLPATFSYGMAPPLDEAAQVDASDFFNGSFARSPTATYIVASAVEVVLPNELVVIAHDAFKQKHECRRATAEAMARRVGWRPRANS